ncbi:MAG: 3-phosphoglycerate dehydrogenase [Peptostreptococcaceae bacterium]|nr:3-phosphoglycerate dehydrogenase [Peptostreptococcaceae bacterium]
MYKIATLNKISPAGLDCFTDKYSITDKVDEAIGIMVRSQDMIEMNFSENLLAIARAGAGVNNIPLARCAAEGIVVFNTPGANSNAVKELVIAGLLLSARNLFSGLNWACTLTDDVSKCVEKGKGQFAGTEIKGKTLGIIGLGAIGVAVANSAEALGMNVLGYDPFITWKAAHELSNTVNIIKSLDVLLPKCDYVTIHVPSLDETNGMLNKERFNQMKDGAVLLNFSRDNLVNDNDLLDAVASGKLGRYVTDFPNDLLINQENIIAIPHLGASTEEAEDNCAAMAAQEIMDYLENGNITNSVNYPEASLGTFITGNFQRICIINKNIPGVIGKITGMLSELNINIKDFINRSKGDFAYTLIDVESDLDESDLLSKLTMDGIISVRILK